MRCKLIPLYIFSHAYIFKLFILTLSLLSVGVGCLSIRVPIRIYFISSDMGVIVDHIPVVMVLRTVFVIAW